MAVEQKGREVFSSIFGNPSNGLSLFSNNTFRRTKTEEVSVKPAGTAVGVSGTEQHNPKQEEAPNDKKKKKKHGAEQGKPRQALDVPESSNERPINTSDRRIVHEARKKAAKGKFPQEVPAEVQKLRLEQLERPLDCHDRRKQEAGMEKKAKHTKRALPEAAGVLKPTKRLKTSDEDGARRLLHVQSENHIEGAKLDGYFSQAINHIKERGSKSEKTKKRKKDEGLEARYEKRLRGVDDRSSNDLSTATQDSGNEKRVKEEGATTQSKKRKSVEIDEDASKATHARTHDADDKLRRTIFVGNLPLKVKKKVIAKEFSVYGTVESLRLRSVPLLDTKIPRKGAIIKGQINEAVDSQHAYVVFKESSHANAALAHNMTEYNGRHMRVDAAHAPHGASKGKPSFSYDYRRSIFVGNIPFDVKDEELYQAFGSTKSPDMEVEAIRVVRDPQTSLSKGIAYVLFKSKAGASPFLSSKRKVKLRDRILRITRVMVPSAAKNQPSPSKGVRKTEDIESSQSQRKRAKLSASYEGVRAAKQGKQQKHGAAGRMAGNKSPKQMKQGPGSLAGVKRKRGEKRQRGMSRSKKIRRT